jgi:GT2 family glycosyltransferase
VPSLRKVGGISTDYQSRMADFDLACKLREEGLHSIVTPLARVRTFESRTNDDSELNVLKQRWPWLIGNDLYVRIDTRADAPSRPA